MKFRKKPVEIEEYRWLENENVKYLKEYENRNCEQCGNHMKTHGWVDTLEGRHIVCPGDWIIKGVKGEYYPCKPDIFELTYDPII